MATAHQAGNRKFVLDDAVAAGVPACGNDACTKELSGSEPDLDRLSPQAYRSAIKLDADLVSGLLP